MIDDKQIEQDLQHWAAWAICRADAGLGWPSSTVGYRLMVEGPEAAGIRGTPQSKVIETDERAELMDRAIHNLPDSLKEAVILRYIKYRSAEASAKAAKCSLRKFWQMVSSAKEKIASWLEGREAMRLEMVRVAGRESVMDHC